MIQLTGIKRKSKKTVFGVNLHGVSLELAVPNTVVDVVTKESKEILTELKNSASSLFDTAIKSYKEAQEKSNKSTTEKTH